VKQGIGIIICVFALLLLQACSDPKQTPVVPPLTSHNLACESFLNDPENEVRDPLPGLDRASKLRWLEKASVALRNGQRLTAADQLDELLKKSRSEIIDMWMQEPAFLDMALDFNMSVWGQKQDSVKNAKQDYRLSVYDVPTAISSAQALAANGDYFGKLFELYPPMYLPAFFSPFPLTPEDAQLPEKQLRLVNIERTLKQIQKWITEFEAKPPTNDAELCKAVVGRIQEDNHFTSFFATGLLGFFNFNLFSLNEQWYNLYFCVNASTTELSVDPLVYLRGLHERNRQFFNTAMQAAENYRQAKSVPEIKAYGPKDFTFTSRPIAFANSFKLALPNSSTNMNRKRAAFVLDKFFCDNLTPINVEDPGSHAGDAHGSQTSCRSCHYKLDPMAGFFANHGTLFDNFSGFKNLVFDDGANTDLKSYVEKWLHNGEWKVGYFRSPTDKVVNTYGRTLEDLFQIIRTAPEVKRCLSKRMFEYLVAPQQVIDAGYLDYLTKEFSCVAEKNSSQAFKRTVKRLVLSRSFNEKNLQPQQCYDYPPNYDPQGAPPCKVAALLQKNCVKCHKSTSGDGRLDLSKWIKSSSSEWNFPHVDRFGAQKTKRQTLSKMAELLSATDEDQRMPKDTYMHPLERESLYLWLQGELKQ
jgi:hypothetical protein